MAADRSVTIRLRVSSAEFDAAMASAGTKVKILAGEIESAGGKGRAGARGLDEFDRSAQRTRGNAGLLLPAIVALGPALIPIGAVAVATAGSLGLMGATGILAFKGVQAEMKAGTPTGLQYAGLLTTLKTNLGELEKTAAKNFLSPFAQSVHQIQGFMPNLNQEIGKFSTLAGKTSGNLLTGMIAGFRDLEPLLLHLGVGIEGVSGKFATWMSNGGMQRFAAYAESVLPQVEQTVVAVAKAIMAITGAAAPMGLISTQALHMVADAINALPVGVLHTLVPLLAGGYLAFKAWAALAPVVATVRGMTAALTAYEAAQLQAAGVTAAAAAANSSAAGGLRLLAASYGPLVLAAVGAAGIVLINNKIAGSFHDMPANAASAALALVKVGQSGEISRQLLTSFGASAGSLNSVLENTFKESVWTKIRDFSPGIGSSFNTATSDAKNFFKSTDAGLTELITLGNKAAADNAFDALAAAAARQGISIDQLMSKLPGYKAAVDAAAAANTDWGAALTPQQQAIQRIASTLGVSVTAYQAATTAIKSNADSLAAATLQMKLQNDAAGLLAAALDKLNGGNQSAAEAQNQYEQAIVNMAKHVHGADAALAGMSSSAIKNRGDLINLAGSAKNAAIAYGKMTDAQGNHIHDTEQSRQRLIALKADLVAQAVGWGENAKEVKAFVDQLITIPPKAVTHGVLETTAADDQLAAYKAKIATLPRTVQTLVYLNGLATAEYQLQLLARNRNAQITVNVGGAGASGVRSVGGVQANDPHRTPGTAAGTNSLPEGYSTINEQGWELLHKRGNQVQVFSHQQSKQMLPDGPSVPAFASGTVSGLVTLTPPKTKTNAGGGGAAAGLSPGITQGPLGYLYNGIYYNSAAAAVNAQTRAEAKASTTIMYNGSSVVEAIVKGITAQSQLGAAAMKKLSAAMADAFELRWVNQKLAALKQEAVQFQQSIMSTLTGRTNVTQVGAGDNNPTGYIASAGAIQAGFNQQTTENNQFGSYIKILGDRGMSKAYLRALEEQGISALPILKLLVNSSKAQDVATGAAYDRSIASAGRAAGVAENQQFGPQIAAFTKLQTKLTTEMSAFVRSATALSNRPIILMIDGKTVLRTSLTAQAKKARQ